MNRNENMLHHEKAFEQVTGMKFERVTYFRNEIRISVPYARRPGQSVDSKIEAVKELFSTFGKVYSVRRVYDEFTVSMACS